MKLDINEGRFSLKYSAIYTLVIILILMIPFAIYDNYTYNLEEVKTEMALKKKSIQIIDEMEQFNARAEDFFTFPRYKSYQAGLYDSDGNPVFTLLEKDITSLDLTSGYHKLDNYRYYVTEFGGNRYFGAAYMVVGTDFNIYAVLENILIVFMLILIIIFVFSYTILKNFAKPFKQINEALDSFIKDSMHEINTPLSIININVDMYGDKFGTNKYLARIKSASKILSTLYDDMNYLIKEQMIAKTKREEIDFSLRVKKSIDYFKDVAELKNITLINRVDEGIVIDFVPAKLQRVIDNNLSNAIKYSYEESDVIITLRQEGEKIVFGVKDFGIGIKEPEKIFSRYYREDHTKGGFGIGLNIVQKIISEENISVEIVSKLNNGSYFEYTFIT